MSRHIIMLTQADKSGPELRATHGGVLFKGQLPTQYMIVLKVGRWAELLSTQPVQDSGRPEYVPITNKTAA